MAELKCDVCNCSYNQDKYCCKGDIMVGGSQACDCKETCCESFIQRNEDYITNSMGRPVSTIRIDCEAGNCMYNSNYKCHAERVEIIGNGANCSPQTACATFREEQDR